MSRRQVNMCNTDLCTSEMDDRLLYNSGMVNSVIPSTENLSAELSELMTNRSYRSKRGNRGISNTSNTSNTSNSRRVSHMLNRSACSGCDDIPKLKRDIICLYDFNKKITNDIKLLREGGDPNCDYLQELTTRINSKASKSDLIILDGKLQQLECTFNDKLHHIEHQHSVFGDPEYEAKIYRYIDCKINEKVDELMEFINQKLEECDKKIDLLSKQLVNTLKNAPVYC